eukprot:2927431-Rhodomonas_salina.3
MGVRCSRPTRAAAEDGSSWTCQGGVRQHVQARCTRRGQPRGEGVAATIASQRAMDSERG